MLGYIDARNDKAIDPIGAIERLTMNLNKSNLISRRDAIDAIEAKEANEFGNYREYNIAFNDGLRSAVYALEDLPSAEKTEVIRCKDCRYRKTPKGENAYCDHDFGGLRCVPMENDFCSYAERRTEE